MRNLVIISVLILAFTSLAIGEEIDVFIKGTDDGVRSNRHQDYIEAVINAKLEAIESAGMNISTILRVVNFNLKYDMV